MCEHDTILTVILCSWLDFCSREENSHFWVCLGHVSVFLASKGNNFASIVVCSRCSSENNNRKLDVKKWLMHNK